MTLRRAVEHLRHQHWTAIGLQLVIVTVDDTDFECAIDGALRCH